MEKGIATSSSIVPWRIPWTGDFGGAAWGHKELDMTEATEHERTM